MAATMIIYNSFIDRVARNLTDLDSGLTVKAMLLTASYTPAQAHDFRDDLTNEVTGTGYTAGGATVTATVATVGASNLTRLTLGQAVWNAAEWALCATLKAMRADDRETGPRTNQQVDAVAGVMAQVDGDLPSAGEPAHRTGPTLNRRVPV